MRLMMRIVLAALLAAFATGVTMLLPPSSALRLQGSAQGQIMAPELAPNLGWLNTDRPLRLREELKGHVVVLDFWTYCCINCIHILPDLEYLEEKYADQPVIVVGVHSAKFTNEEDRESIRQAMFRYDIKHPVVIDSGMGIWRKYGIRGWPGFAVIGTDGQLIGITGGEGQRAVLDGAIERALAEGRDRGDIAPQRVSFELDAMVAPATGLSFPGKVLADRQAGYVFIADSSDDRVIVTSYPDAAGRSELVRIIGTGERGLADGAPDAARLHDPQGMALDRARNLLYIADTKNHAIRALELSTWALSTIAGTGEQVYDRKGGGKGTEQGMASPWDLVLSPDGGTLYIAMAGPHQIWSMDLKSRVVKRLAGSGRENSLDGPLEEAALAQPSGLALSADGQRLYFADSESSSVRVVDLREKLVKTVVGYNVSSQFENGLFEFGLIDGAYPEARLQHCLGVALLPGDGPDRLLVADTYNHALRSLDAASRTITTIAAGRTGEGLTLDEPGGVYVDQGSGLAFIADTNNHRVVIFDPATGEHREMTVAGLGATGEPNISTEGAAAASVSFDPAAAVSVSVAAELPEKAHANAEAPTTVRISNPATGRVLAQRTLRTDTLPVSIELPAGASAAGDTLLIELSFAWCTDGDLAVCIPGNVSWLASVQAGTGSAVSLSAPVQ